MKALVGAFNQEKALVGAFSVIVQPVVEPMEHHTALVLTNSSPEPASFAQQVATITSQPAMCHIQICEEPEEKFRSVKI